jgi:hypothetical protein
VQQVFSSVIQHEEARGGITKLSIVKRAAAAAFSSEQNAFYKILELEKQTFNPPNTAL